MKLQPSWGLLVVLCFIDDSKEWAYNLLQEDKNNSVKCIHSSGIDECNNLKYCYAVKPMSYLNISVGF